MIRFALFPQSPIERQAHILDMYGNVVEQISVAELRRRQKLEQRKQATMEDEDYRTQRFSNGRTGIVRATRRAK